MADPKSEIHSRDAREPRGTKIDMKLEAFIIPVSDVDRAKQFYTLSRMEARRRLPLR